MATIIPAPAGSHRAGEGLKQGLMMLAQVLGQYYGQKSQKQQAAEFAKSLSPTQIPTAGGQSIFTTGGAEALTEGWLGGQPTKTGMMQGPRLTSMQIMQKALTAGYPVQEAIGMAKLAPQADGVERGALPWYQWPEYKDSPAAQRARGERARVAKPFGPSSTSKMKDDIDERIRIIKSGPQKGPGAGRIRGPDFAQSDVLNNYIEEAEAIGYRSLSAAQQRQFDALWDTKMRAQKDFVWDPKSKEVKATRSALRTGNLPERAEPQSQEEFLKTVESIKDETKAKAYYDKWVSKWQ